MKRITITFLFLLPLALFCSAQNNGQGETEIIKKATRTLNIVKLNNGKEFTSRDLIVGPQQIEKLDVLTREKINESYSSSKADLVLVFTLKPGVANLLTLKQILDKYKIDPQYRNYKVLDEGLEVEDPNSLLASEDVLTNVIVNKDKQFLNIITTMHDRTLKTRQEAKEERMKRAKEFKPAGN